VHSVHNGASTLLLSVRVVADFKFLLSMMNSGNVKSKRFLHPMQSTFIGRVTLLCSANAAINLLLTI